MNLNFKCGAYPWLCRSSLFKSVDGRGEEITAACRHHQRRGSVMVSTVWSSTRSKNLRSVSSARLTDEWIDTRRHFLAIQLWQYADSSQNSPNRSSQNLKLIFNRCLIRDEHQSAFVVAAGVGGIELRPKGIPRRRKRLGSVREGPPNSVLSSRGFTLRICEASGTRKPLRPPSRQGNCPRAVRE